MSRSKKRNESNVFEQTKRREIKKKIEQENFHASSIILSSPTLLNPTIVISPSYSSRNDNSHQQPYKLSHSWPPIANNLTNNWSLLPTCSNSQTSPSCISSCSPPTPTPSFPIPSFTLSCSDLNLISNPIPSRESDAAQPKTALPIETPDFFNSTRLTIGAEKVGESGDRIEAKETVAWEDGREGMWWIVMNPEVPLSFAG